MVFSIKLSTCNQMFERLSPNLAHFLITASPKCCIFKASQSEFNGVCKLKIKQLASQKNLELAWRRITTGNNLQYKKFFRDLYYSYEISLKENLRDLRERLINSSCGQCMLWIDPSLDLGHKLEFL